MNSVTANGTVMIAKWTIANTVIRAFIILTAVAKYNTWATWEYASNAAAIANH
jgi:hypothetical protein